MKNVDPMEKLFKMLRVNNICSKLQIIFSKNKKASKQWLIFWRLFANSKSKGSLGYPAPGPHKSLVSLNWI